MRPLLLVIPMALGALAARPVRAACTGVTDASAAAWPDGRHRPGRLRPNPSPALAAGLALVPGAGHAWLCDWGGMGLTLGATLGPMQVAGAMLADDATLDDPLAMPVLYLSQNAWFYSIYDAWRLARLARSPDDGPPVDGAGPLAHLQAPFRRSNLADPWVLGATALGASLAGLAATTGHGEALWNRPTAPWSGEELPSGVVFVGGEAVLAGTFVTVGPGEEALFRGLVQANLVHATGPVAGIALSSVLFGLAHYPNGTDTASRLGTAAVTGAIGSGLGLLAHLDGYRLDRPIAAHFWYDMAVGTVGFLVDPEAMPWSTGFQGSF